ncbi:DedA family protein [Ruicaihuangia caeni]|uniref:DedA family protein n=1 Tax=Ruicaihuangia caeni TaxID=3042517 RepID=UPI00338F185C
MPIMASGLFDIEGLLHGAGPWALAVVCAIIFVESGLLVGFLLPGDTLLIITGVLLYQGFIDVPVWLACLLIFVSAFLGDQLGYYIGVKSGPAIFEKRATGFFSRASIERTDRFFTKYGGLAVTIARFIGVVRTLTPVAAGVGRMHYGRFVAYNALGGLVWGAGLTFTGWAVAHIPAVRDFVTQYLEFVLLGVIALTLAIIGTHWVRMRLAIRRERSSSAGHTSPGQPNPGQPNSAEQHAEGARAVEPSAVSLDLSAPHPHR